jgi:flagellar biosynthesis chaperone FliJ
MTQKYEIWHNTIVMKSYTRCVDVCFRQLMKENAERERLNRLKEQSEEDFTEDDSDDDTGSVDDFLDPSPKMDSMSEVNKLVLHE